MWELEAWPNAMAWDWDADDINPDDNDGKLWVPVMAQTLKTGAAEEDRAIPPAGPATPARQMKVYMVQENEAHQCPFLSGAQPDCHPVWVHAILTSPIFS